MAKNVSDDQQLLLDQVPNDGTTIGNTTLRRTLEWDEEKYWRVRNPLIDQGILVVGRGQGGSVRKNAKAETETVTPNQADAAAVAIRQQETALYPPIAESLGNNWRRDLNLEELFVEITAKQGRRETGGPWSRPDLVVVYVSTYQNIPGKFVDVVTFEVKTHENFNITSVYEALAHLRAATRAYLLVSIPSDKQDELRKQVDAVAEEAGRHGIGLIVAGDVNSFDTWVFRVEADTIQPSVAKLDDFIERQISDENKKKLRKWIK